MASTQTQRIRDAETRYMESAQLVRELRAENEKLKASMKRLRARVKKKAPKLEHQIKRAGRANSPSKSFGGIIVKYSKAVQEKAAKLFYEAKASGGIHCDCAAKGVSHGDHAAIDCALDVAWMDLLEEVADDETP